VRRVRESVRAYLSIVYKDPPIMSASVCGYTDKTHRAGSPASGGMRPLARDHGTEGVSRLRQGILAHQHVKELKSNRESFG